jgi:hypothetical protein
MPEKKREEFKVTDRRLFTPEGELRPEVDETERETSSTSQTAPASPSAPESASAASKPPEPPNPPLPTTAEQQAQHDAYRSSTKDLDAQLRKELGGHAHELEMTFERFLASLYMTALLQLGLVHEQGAQPQVDLIAARQTIDTLGLLQEKTKGNLTDAERGFLQNCLYELRMAYVEVTNALARPPQPAGSETGPRSR